MSLLFKPKIKESYVDLVPESRKRYVEGVLTKSILAKKPKTDYNPWSPADIERLIQLRGANISYNNIGKLLKRSPASCGWTVHDRMLRLEIRIIQKKLIEEIMND
jgi:hypothetical protein|tara:strand:- start:1018 stop:1332 length:315 start_codon:yes stop_codon:yes gene_type:complete